MNDLLVGGCAAGGMVAGIVLDEIGARVPPARSATGTDATADQEGGVRTEPVAAVRPAPPSVAERVGIGALTAVLFGAAAVRFGPVPELAAYCVLFGGLVCLSVADVRVGLVPRKILYPTLGLMTVALVAASAVAGDWRSLLDAAIGGLAGFAAFFVVWFISPRAMGFGDVRLAGLVGAGLGWLGFRQLYLGFLASLIVGVVIGVAKMLVQGTGRKTALPFGPALAAGAVIGVLWGGYLANLWFHPGG